MICIETALGSVEISQEYFSNIVGKAVSECFGVAGMVSTPTQGIRSVFARKDMIDRGIRVRTSGGKLVIDLHITVVYGMNISEIVKSIMNRVRYTVQEATNLTVAKVNVYVDSMKTDNN